MEGRNEGVYLELSRFTQPDVSSRARHLIDGLVRQGEDAPCRHLDRLVEQESHLALRLGFGRIMGVEGALAGRVVRTLADVPGGGIGRVNARGAGTRQLPELFRVPIRIQV